MTSPSSPSGSSPVVTLSATLDFNGTPIPITSNVNSSSGTPISVVFNLQNPVDLGTLSDFYQWLSTKFSIQNVSTYVQDAVNLLPDGGFKTDLSDLINGLSNDPFYLNTLSIDTGHRTYALGAGMQFPGGTNLFGDLYLDSVGFLVSVGGSGSPG